MWRCSRNVGDGEQVDDGLRLYDGVKEEEEEEEEEGDEGISNDDQVSWKLNFVHFDTVINHSP